MNDEIKEILDNLIENKEGLKDETYYPEDLINSEDLILLLDYITNLQQENEELKKNQRYYKNGVFSLEYDKETLSDMVDDYKSRVERAIEYINGYKELVGMTGKLVYNLLYILQNGSDEE